MNDDEENFFKIFSTFFLIIIMEREKLPNKNNIYQIFMYICIISIQMVERRIKNYEL